MPSRIEPITQMRRIWRCPGSPRGRPPANRRSKRYSGTPRGGFSPRNRVRAASGDRVRTGFGAVPNPPSRRRHGPRTVGQPDGDRRVRVRRIHRARPAAAGGAVRADGVCRGGAAPLEKRHALQAGRHQFHPQCRAGELRAGLRAAARAVGLRDGVPRQGCRRGLRARDLARRQAGARQGRPDGAEHPGDRGDRRQPDLSRRPLRRAHDLRCRFHAADRQEQAAPASGSA